MDEESVPTNIVTPVPSTQVLENNVSNGSMLLMFQIKPTPG